MQKAFLSIFLLCLLFSSFPASASSLPEVRSAVQLVRLFESHLAARRTQFSVRMPRGLSIPLADVLSACSVPAAVAREVTHPSGIKVVTYNFALYPGMRVADAYLSGNLAGLSDDEVRLYRKAAAIVENARGLSPIVAELRFHDVVCQTAEYLDSGTAEMGLSFSRNSTALGVFLDGRANCQGYSDAMAMLCRMFGMRAVIRGGLAKNRPHAWNLVNLGDGNGWHAVDATWDDLEARKQGFVSHVYFNIPAGLLRETHSWKDWDGIAINAEMDRSYYYARNERPFGFYVQNPRDAARFIAGSLLRGATDVKVMTWTGPGQAQSVLGMVEAEVRKSGRALRWSTSVQSLGGYAFLTASKR